jgi:hypothetical protein
MLRVTFADAVSRDAFAERFKLDTKVGDNQLDIGWHLLQFAKLDDKALDYDELAVLTASPEANAEREFIVKGDPAVFGAHATVVRDLGNGFHLVKATDGTLLGDHVESIEHNSSPMTLLENTSDLNNFNAEDTTLDPTSKDAQWSRLRVASRYRPLTPEYKTHNTTYSSKPELFILDSGINFDHPEFDYPTLDKVDFYKVPRFATYADEKGHGTAVASMAVGKNLGIASNLKLCSVKLGDATTTASLLEIGEAIDAILNHISQNLAVTRVVNISWTTARSAWLDAKIEALQAAGATVVCAAGNNGISVEDLSPAGINSVITVGAIDKYDIPAGFNNISPDDSGTTTGSGLSLDLFAPGVGCYVANFTGGYKITSGTSFAAPLVAGIATEIASMFSAPVPYNQLKDLVLNTATKNALLFEDDRFSDNQNNLAYIFTSDSSTIYKSQNLSSYLGVHNADDPIVANLNTLLETASWNKVFPNDPPVWSLKFDDPAIEAAYGPFISCTSAGVVTLNKPTVVLPPEVKLQAVNFRGVAKNASLESTTLNLFFFHLNPDYSSTMSADITQALSEMNTITYAGAWFFIK